METEHETRKSRGGALAAGDGAYFFWRVIRGVFTGRVGAYWVEVMRQSRLLVSSSMLVILGMVLALGLVVGVEASYGARLVGAPAAAGAFTAIGNLREIVPYAFAYMMAAKVSTGYAAEIGTMRITDEVDALEVMGLDSLVYLSSTRLLGMWLVLPFVYAIAMVVAFAGSYVVVVNQIGQVSAGGYFELFWKFQSPSDYLFGAVKAGAMSTFVVLSGCYFGYRIRSGGPVEVGRATAKAMIINLIGIHFIGIVGSELFWGGAPRLPIGG